MAEHTTPTTTPFGFCHCGCGQNTNISKYNSKQHGWIKGQPRKFLPGHEARLRKLDDLSGQVFGRWTVLHFSHLDKSRTAHWICQCECGTEKSVRAPQLKAGTSRSCGCLLREIAATRNRTHGLSKHPLRSVYQAMKARCYSPNDLNYPNYGNRGIYVCARWKQSLANFINDMGERPSPDHSLDRIDNDGPYSPENCRWATPEQQHNNMQQTRYLEWNGKRQSVTQWARELGIAPNTIRRRIHVGWPIDRILGEAPDMRYSHNRPKVIASSS